MIRISGQGDWCSLCDVELCVLFADGSQSGSTASSILAGTDNEFFMLDDRSVGRLGVVFGLTGFPSSTLSTELALFVIEA